MRIARHLCLILVLLALPAGIAHAQTCGTQDFGDGSPCRTRITESDCTAECGGFGPVSPSCVCVWDDPTNPSGAPMDTSNGANSDCSETHPCCWNRPCHLFGNDAEECAAAGGGSRVPLVEDRCHWFPDASGSLVHGRCGCRPPLVEVPRQCSFPAGLEYYAPFDCYSPLDHFTFYKVKTSKGADKFARFGPVDLTDSFESTDTGLPENTANVVSVPYQVTKPVKLGLPSDKNGEGVRDAGLHMEEYLVKPVKGGPVRVPRSDVHVVNQCNDLLLEVTKPVSLLVPTAKSSTGPVAGPVPADGVFKHFLCYQAKPQAKLADGSKLPKFPRGIQVDVADQFQTRRYDLLKITKLCNPVEKEGTVFASDPSLLTRLLSGPNKGAPKPITPAGRWSPDERLVCYRARLATKRIAQSGCGPTTPGDKGTKIVPKQAKHKPVTGLYVANQFGAERLDTGKRADFCIPSSVDMN
jgi:hypothetical protein